jgi:hypothetical protein
LYRRISEEYEPKATVVHIEGDNSIVMVLDEELCSSINSAVRDTATFDAISCEMFNCYAIFTSSLHQKKNQFNKNSQHRNSTTRRLEQLT